MPIRFAMVAGEDSGDILGSDLIVALQERFPNAIFEGIGGPRMIALGFKSFFPLERLSVMGIWEPLKRLPEILAIRRYLKSYFVQHQPTVFIGIDAPDFNLSLESFLKKNHIKTVHYVSPTVWAWRKGRIKNIKKAVDLMLTLFPFENSIYKAHAIPVVHVGHPLADKIPMVSDKVAARQILGLPLDKKIVAILPGSRAQELKYILPEFVETAKWLKKHDEQLQFITACPNEARETQFKAFLHDSNGPGIQIFTHLSTTVMASADAILLASGTATLEAMLVKRPSVCAYKMSPLTFEIAKRLVKVPFIALPNLLANHCIMPEFIQSQVKAPLLGKLLLDYISDPQSEKKILPIFEKIHLMLKKNSGETAANAIELLIKDEICQQL